MKTNFSDFIIHFLWIIIALGVGFLWIWLTYNLVTSETQPIPSSVAINDTIYVNGYPHILKETKVYILTPVKLKE